MSELLLPGRISELLLPSELLSGLLLLSGRLSELLLLSDCLPGLHWDEFISNSEFSSENIDNCHFPLGHSKYS